MTRVSRNEMGRFRTHVLFAGMLSAGIFGAGYFLVPSVAPLVYDTNVNPLDVLGGAPLGEEESEPAFVVTHLATPKPLKAIYMTSWVAGTPSWRSSLAKMIEETELNAIIIDIKDYSGRVAFHTDDPLVNSFGASENRIPDIKEFLAELHDKGIYTIGRITVFQDPHLTSQKPEWAVKRLSDGTVWKDYKGLSFIEPGAKDAWDYYVAIARASYELGFDELNFDYIRFPSDGNMKDIYYPWSEQRIIADPRYGKAKILKEFFAYLDEELSDPSTSSGQVPVLSADFFGMTTTNTDDLNIGQVMEYALPYFDYIAPMVYPSHYPKGFNGWPNPNQRVYDVVKYSLDRAASRLVATTTSIAALGDKLVSTTTPWIYSKPSYEITKIRPWLQDFDYGGEYGADEVRAQIQATYDAGLDSWMLWDPANRYTREALLPAEDVAPAPLEVR